MSTQVNLVHASISSPGRFESNDHRGHVRSTVSSMLKIAPILTKFGEFLNMFPGNRSPVMTGYHIARKNMTVHLETQFTYSFQLNKVNYNDLSQHTQSP